MMLAACTPHGDGPAIQDLGDIAIETMARDAKPSPEGGCEVQTGPFTTMHFPRGHEVCRNVADLGDQVKPLDPDRRGRRRLRRCSWAPRSRPSRRRRRR